MYLLGRFCTTQYINKYNIPYKHGIKNPGYILISLFSNKRSYSKNKIHSLECWELCIIVKVIVGLILSWQRISKNSATFQLIISKWDLIIIIATWIQSHILFILFTYSLVAYKIEGANKRGVNDFGIYKQKFLMLKTFISNFSKGFLDKRDGQYFNNKKIKGGLEGGPRKILFFFNMAGYILFGTWE